MVEGVDVYGANSLSEVVQFLRGEGAMEPVRSTNDWSDTGSVDQELDFGEVKGQQPSNALSKSPPPGAQYSHRRRHNRTGIRRTLTGQRGSSAKVILQPGYKSLGFCHQTGS
jgi:hypothetical protein